MRRRPAQVFARLSGSDIPARHTQLLDTAVVLGGSIAGLMAARVLADHATTVLVVERDEPETGEHLRRCTADLPALFGAAASGARLGEIRTYHQADTRRRDFHLTRLPARLVSVGDAVASFNTVYGQGISSAALHASCLAAYLGSNPDLGAPAREFFDLQRMVVDAAWAISATADAARRPEPEPPSARERVRRWLAAELVAAASTDRVIARRFEAVATMQAHPTTLARPHIALRALAVAGQPMPSVSARAVDNDHRTGRVQGALMTD